MKKREDKSGLSESFIAGVIAIVFLLVGYQTALFIHRASVMKIVSNRDEPDTVFVFRYFNEAQSHKETYQEDRGNLLESKKESRYEAKRGEDSIVIERKQSGHSQRSENVRKNIPRRQIESFLFDPNTVSVEDLYRLGFTPKQAQSIDNYRKKGGRFRRKEDFSKSFVVSDSIYRRLEPFIDIPLTDLNLADSSALDALPGIGSWYATKIIEYRYALGGYSYKEQLMDVQRFDEEKFNALKDLITVSPEHQTPYRLWSLPADSLQLHPYISNIETARSIVLFRENSPKDQWTVDALEKAGILSHDNAERLSQCLVTEPE